MVKSKSVLAEQPVTVSQIFQLVQRYTAREQLPFPRDLRWEEGVQTARGYEFTLQRQRRTQKGHILLPTAWARPLSIWSQTHVDDYGVLLHPETPQLQGYVFSAPGEHERKIGGLLGWMLSGERDLTAALYAGAEAALTGRDEDFLLSWYETPLPPCGVRFLQWYRLSSTHAGASVMPNTTAARGWLSRFGVEAICTPEDPILWSYCFARAGSLKRYRTAFLWLEEWRPWIEREYKTRVPEMPGIPEAVLRAHEARPQPLEACWTPEWLAAADDDPLLSVLLTWATADGRVPPKARVTPYLPRFAGGETAARPVVLEEPWDYASEINAIKQDGAWWGRPQLARHYPNREQIQEFASISVPSFPRKPSAHGSAPVLPPVEYGSPVPGFSSELGYVLIRVPAGIASAVQNYAEQLLTGQGREPVTEPVPVPPETVPLQEAPKPRRRRASATPPKVTLEGAYEMPAEGNLDEDMIDQLSPENDTKGQEGWVEGRPPAWTAEEAIALGWDRHVWLCIYRRKPDVPDPYELRRRQQIGDLPADHPMFPNGFLIPPAWIDLLSNLWHRMGIISARDRLDIPGLESYLNIPWTAAGDEEWDAAMSSLQ